MEKVLATGNVMAVVSIVGRRENMLTEVLGSGRVCQPDQMAGRQPLTFAKPMVSLGLGEHWLTVAETLR